MKINQIQSDLKKKHGDHFVTSASDTLDVERIPTGIFHIDRATGGGLPRGKSSNIWGEESTGKTNIAIKTMAMHQKLWPDEICVFVDLENAFDKKWATRLGLDVSKIALFRPDYGEQAVDIIQGVLASEDCGLTVVDSVASLVPVNEQDSTAEKAQVGGNALLISKMLKKCTVVQAQQASKGRFPSLLLLNQMRKKIGVMFGNPESQPGGHALRHVSGLTIQMYGGNDIIDKAIDEHVPAFKEMKGKITKNKVPYLSKQFEFMFPSINKGGIRIGEVDDHKPFEAMLKAAGWLEKTKKGVVLLDLEFKTFKAAWEWLDDPENADQRLELRTALLEQAMTDKYGIDDDVEA